MPRAPSRSGKRRVVSRSAPHPVSGLQRLRETELKERKKKKKERDARVTRCYARLCPPHRLYENRDSGGTSRSALLELGSRTARVVKFPCGCCSRTAWLPSPIDSPLLSFLFSFSLLRAHVIFPGRPSSTRADWIHFRGFVNA